MKIHSEKSLTSVCSVEPDVESDVEPDANMTSGHECQSVHVMH